MNPVIFSLSIVVVIILAFVVYFYRVTNDLIISFICLIFASFLLFVFTIVFASFAHREDGASNVKTEKIEVSAITLGENYKDNYIFTSPTTSDGKQVTTVVSKKDGNTISFINKETGELETFNASIANIIVGDKESVVVTYSELTEESNWYFMLGKDRNVINYTVTIKEEE